MFDIAHSFRSTGPHNYVYTVNVKSLYTVILNNNGRLALSHFLNKRTVSQPPTCHPGPHRRICPLTQYIQRKLLQTDLWCRDGK